MLSQEEFRGTSNFQKSQGYDENVAWKQHQGSYNL